MHPWEKPFQTPRAKNYGIFSLILVFVVYNQYCSWRLKSENFWVTFFVQVYPYGVEYRNVNPTTFFLNVHPWEKPFQTARAKNNGIFSESKIQNQNLLVIHLNSKIKKYQIKDLQKCKIQTPRIHDSKSRIQESENPWESNIQKSKFKKKHPNSIKFHHPKSNIQNSKISSCFFGRSKMLWTP